MLHRVRQREKAKNDYFFLHLLFHSRLFRAIEFIFIFYTFFWSFLPPKLQGMVCSSCTFLCPSEQLNVTSWLLNWPKIYMKVGKRRTRRRRKMSTLHKYFRLYFYYFADFECGFLKPSIKSKQLRLENDLNFRDSRQIFLSFFLSFLCACI